MSVINRMLKDLDNRQHTARTQTYTPAAVAPQPIHWIWIVLTVLISAAVIVGGLNLWWLYSAEVTNSEAEPVVQTAPVRVEVEEAQAKEPELVAEPTPQTPTKQNKAIVDVSAFEPLPEPANPIEATDEVVKAEPQSRKKQPPQPAVESSGTFAVTRVQLSPDELAANNLEKARAAFNKGDRAEGQSLLEKALVVKPDHVEVRSELAAYWYGRGMTTRALTLLQQGLDMRPQQAEWQLLFARILERIGRVEQAYTALLNIRDDAPEATELLQLRAAAATQLGYFNEAAADYTVLATQFGEGRWWLAAAVAHEDGDNLEAAVRCYNQALQSGDLGSDAREYIQQRLAVLEGY